MAGLLGWWALGDNFSCAARQPFQGITLFFTKHRTFISSNTMGIIHVFSVLLQSDVLFEPGQWCLSAHKGISVPLAIRSVWIQALGMPGLAAVPDSPGCRARLNGAVAPPGPALILD